MPEICPFISTVQIPFDGEGVSLRQTSVGPEPGMRQMRAVLAILSGQVGEMIVIEVFREHPVTRIPPDFSAILGSANSQLLGATARYQQATLSVGSSLSDNVDDAVHRVGAPYRCPRTANHFNLLNVFERNVLGIPVDPREHW